MVCEPNIHVQFEADFASVSKLILNLLDTSTADTRRKKAHWRADAGAHACGRLDSGRSDNNQIQQSYIWVYHTESKN